MPARCSAPRCNSNKEGCCCTTFAQDPNWKQKWIDAVGIPNWKPLKLALLCEVGTKVCIEMFYNVTSVNIKNNISIIISYLKNINVIIQYNSCCT